MEYYERDGHTAFRSASGKECFLPESAALDVPHFRLVSRSGTNDCRCFYECDDVNAKGERLRVELGFHENFAGRQSGPIEWHKRGFTDHVLTSWWSFNTEVTDERGKWGRYNPCVKPGNLGRYQLDFEWAGHEATKENALRLFAECRRRFLEVRR